MQTEQPPEATLPIAEHSITKVAIADLVFDNENPNKLSDGQMQGLRKSMEQYGYLTPIIVDKNTGKIADGEHRALVYKELGVEEIPAILIDLESDIDRKQLRQVMNKLRGIHDKQLDANELVQIFQAQKLDELCELIAQPRQDLERMMLRYHPKLDFVTPENEGEIDKLIDEELKRIVPDTQLGDIWQLGDHQHRLMCADCSDQDSIDKLFGSHKANLTITSPPYDNLRNYEGFSFDFQAIAKHLYAITENGGIVVWVVGDAVIDGSESLSSFKHALYFRETGFNVHDTMIYAKTGFSMPSTKEAKRYHQAFEYMFVFSKGPVKTFNPIVDRSTINAGTKYNLSHRRDESGELQYVHFSPREYADFSMRYNIWTYSPSYGSSAPDYLEAHDHPAIFPLSLCKDHIDSWTNEGDLIYDPMLGSGTTLIAAEQTSRKCYGIDISPRYIDIAVKRWEKYTGKKASKVSN